MKKLFTYLLFTVLALLTTECKVSNLEPVPPNTTQISDFKITKEFVYKSDVYILKMGLNGEINYLDNDRLVILGDYDISLPNGRISGSELPEKAIIIASDKKEIHPTLEISDKIKISGGYSYKYELLNWYAAFKAGAVIYRETTSINVTLSSVDGIEVEVPGKVKKIKITPSGEHVFEKTSLKSEEIQDGKLIYGREELVTENKTSLKCNISAEFEKDRKFILKNLELPSFVLPIGIGVRITPSIEFGVVIKGRGAVEGSFEFLMEDKIKKILEVRNEKWEQIDSKYIKEPTGTLIPTANVTGTLTIAPVVALNFDILRLNLTVDKQSYVSAGGISINCYYYSSFVFNCSTQNLNGNDPNKLVYGAALTLEIFVGRKVIKGEDKRLLNSTISLAKRENPIKNISSLPIFCKEILTPIPINTAFTELLVKYNFPLYEGNNPPKLTEPGNIFKSNSTILKKSNDEKNDIFNYSKDHGSIKYLFSNQQSNTIKVESKRNLEHIDSQGYDEIKETSITANIYGNTNKFTIIGKSSSTIKNKNGTTSCSGYVAEFAISGEKLSNTEIQNLRFAYRVIGVDMNNCSEFDIQRLAKEGVYRDFSVLKLQTTTVF